MAWLPWVVLAHDVAGDAGALDHGAVGAETLVEHVPEDPAVDRLQTVAHIGQGPGGDGGQRVDEIRLLHLGLELDRLRGCEVEGRRLVAHSAASAHSAVVTLPSCGHDPQICLRGSRGQLAVAAQP